MAVVAIVSIARFFSWLVGVFQWTVNFVVSAVWWMFTLAPVNLQLLVLTTAPFLVAFYRHVYASSLPALYVLVAALGYCRMRFPQGIDYRWR